MQRYQSPMNAAAILLAALAGFVDAIAYISLGGFFASFMSGNTTRLGVGLATGVPGDVWRAGSLILAFLCGVMISSILAARFERHRIPMAMVAIALILALAALLTRFVEGALPLLLLATALGVESGAFLRDSGESGIGLAYLTATLVRIGQTLTEALLGRGSAFGWARHVALWLGFAGGVVLGGIAIGDHGLDALWFAAGAALALAGLLALPVRDGVKAG